MELDSKFLEPPYTFHGPNVFYKSFRYHDQLLRPSLLGLDQKAATEPHASKCLSIGDYFFIRVPFLSKRRSISNRLAGSTASADAHDVEYVCLLAQLQLLWINRDRISSSALTAARSDVKLLVPSSVERLNCPNYSPAPTANDHLSPEMRHQPHELRPLPLESESEDLYDVLLPSSLNPVPEPALTPNGSGGHNGSPVGIDSYAATVIDNLSHHSPPSSTAAAAAAVFKKPGRGRPRKVAVGINGHDGSGPKIPTMTKAWARVQNLPQTAENRFANVKVFLTPAHILSWLSNPGYAYKYGEDEVIQLETSVSLSFDELMRGILNYNHAFASPPDHIRESTSPMTNQPPPTHPPSNPYIEGWNRDSGFKVSSAHTGPHDKACLLTYPAYLRYRSGLVKMEHDQAYLGPALDEEPFKRAIGDGSLENNLPCSGGERCDLNRLDDAVVGDRKASIRFLFCKSTYPDETGNLTKSLFSTCTQAPVFRGRPKKDKTHLPKNKYRLSSLNAYSSHAKLLKNLTSSCKTKFGYGSVKRKFDVWKSFMHRPHSIYSMGTTLYPKQSDTVDGDSDDKNGIVEQKIMHLSSDLTYGDQTPNFPPPHATDDLQGWRPPSITGVQERKRSNVITFPLTGEDPVRDQFFTELRNFMSRRGTPIKKIPYLGFRPVDLYNFYKLVKSMGGYREVRLRRLWKRLYEHMGGCPNNTSAATCTRKHYENLLLPFEIYENRRDKNGSSADVTLPSPDSPIQDERELHQNGRNDENHSQNVEAVLQNVDSDIVTDPNSRRADNVFLSNHDLAAPPGDSLHNGVCQPTQNGRGNKGSSASVSSDCIDRLLSLIAMNKKVNKSSQRHSNPTTASGEGIKRKRGRPRLTEEEKRSRSTRVPTFHHPQNAGNPHHLQGSLPFGTAHHENNGGGLFIRKPKLFQTREETNEESILEGYGNHNISNHSSGGSPIDYPTTPPSVDNSYYGSCEQRTGGPGERGLKVPYPSMPPFYDRLDPLNPFPQISNIQDTAGFSKYLDFPGHFTAENGNEHPYPPPPDFVRAPYNHPCDRLNSHQSNEKKKRGRPSNQPFNNWHRHPYYTEQRTTESITPHYTHTSETPYEFGTPSIDYHSPTPNSNVHHGEPFYPGSNLIPHPNDNDYFMGISKRKRGRPPKVGEEKVAGYDHTPWQSLSSSSSPFTNHREVLNSDHGMLPPFPSPAQMEALLPLLPLLSHLPQFMGTNGAGGPLGIPLQFSPSWDIGRHASPTQLDNPPKPIYNDNHHHAFPTSHRRDTDLPFSNYRPKNDPSPGGKEIKNSLANATTTSNATTAHDAYSDPHCKVIDGPDNRQPSHNVSLPRLATEEVCSSQNGSSYSPVRQLRNPNTRRKGKVPLRITRNNLESPSVSAQCETPKIGTPTDSVPIITNGWSGVRPSNGSSLSKAPPAHQGYDESPRESVKITPDRVETIMTNGNMVPKGHHHQREPANPAYEDYKRVMEKHYRAYLNMAAAEHHKGGATDMSHEPEIVRGER